MVALQGCHDRLLGISNIFQTPLRANWNTHLSNLGAKNSEQEQFGLVGGQPRKAWFLLRRGHFEKRTMGWCLKQLCEYAEWVEWKLERLMDDRVQRWNGPRMSGWRTMENSLGKVRWSSSTSNVNDDYGRCKNKKCSILIKLRAFMPLSSGIGKAYYDFMLIETRRSKP